MQAAFMEIVVAEQALDGEHLAERVGDRRAGGEHQRAAGVLRFEEPGLYKQIPCALRAVGIDALQRAHVGGEAELAEFLRLIDDNLVDADFRDGEQIVLAGSQRCQTLLQPLLQPFEPLARDAVVAVNPGQQILVELQLVLDHALLEGGGNGDEPEGGVGDDDRIPGRRRRA